LKRGEVWTASGGSDYAGKPRPVVIVQDDRYDATASITVCGFTSGDLEGPLPRPAIEPSEANGLRLRSFLMVDKLTTVPRGRLGQRLGVLDPEEMRRVDRAMLVFLGLAG
jgi:mRNA interferase MazF